MGPLLRSPSSFRWWSWVSPGRSGRSGDQVGFIGPLDKAKFGWLVVVPLLLIGPGVGAFLGGGLRQTSRLVAALTLGVTVAIVITAGLAAATTQIGCTPITPGLEAVPRVFPVGLTWGTGITATVLVAGRIGAGARRGWVALLIGIGGAAISAFAALVALALAFPAVSCPWIR